MISSKSDLKLYLTEELGRYIPYPFNYYNEFLLWIKGSQFLRLWKFHYALRKYEYYLNKKKMTIFGKFVKQFWRFKYRHRQLKYEIYIAPNQCGHGLRLCHPGYRYLNETAKLGNYCTILPMVLIGTGSQKGGKVFIGDYVDISTGVTILSPVRIGDNVKIGAGAVVNKDIPSNCTIAGVPARILKNESDVREIAIKRFNVNNI